jgi:hypothetical protein
LLLQILDGIARMNEEKQHTGSLVVGYAVATRTATGRVWSSTLRATCAAVSEMSSPTTYRFLPASAITS